MGIPQTLSISGDQLFISDGNSVTLPASFSGDYNDLTNTPQIPTVPTQVSAFENDANYITSADVPAIPTNVSAFENDANYITAADVPAIPTNVSAFTNDAGYLTSFTEQQVLTISNDTLFLTGGSFVKLPAGFDGNYNSLTNRPELFSGDYNDLTNQPQIPTVPTNVSAFANDAGYVTESTLTANNYITQSDLITNNYATTADIPTNVSAFENDANYITAADVPAIPTNVSSFTNDAGYITMDSIPEIPAVPTNISAFVNDAGYLTTATVQEAANIPTNVSAFTNDANYITAADVPAIPTNVSAFENDANYITSADVPVIPTNVSAFTNDAGYLTSFTEQQVLTISNDTLFLTGGSFVKMPAGFDGNYNSLTNLPELFSGNYNELTNKPTIPTVPTQVSAFENDANYITAADVPAIPTNVSAFANDANYITSEDIPAYQVLSISNDTIYLSNGGYAVLPAGFDGNYNSLSNKPDLFSGNYNDLTDKPTIPTVPTNVSAFTNDANYITNADVPAIPTNVSAFTNDAGYITMDSIPAIPTVPTNVSAFANDAGYLTSATVQEAANIPTNVSAFNNDAGYITMDSIPAIPTIPTNISAFTNDAGYVTESTLTTNNYITQNDLITNNYATTSDIPTNVSAFTNDAGYITMDSIPAIPTVPTNVSSFTNDANYITSADVPAIPTNVSAFTNDAGYLTEYTEQQVLSISNDTIYLTGGSFAKLPAGFSGSYNDLTDRPDIPTIPTEVSTFNNDAGYLTEVSLSEVLDSLYHLIDSLKLSSNENEVIHPSVRTSPISYYTSDKADVGGVVISEGSSPIRAKGVCYSTHQHPLIDDSHLYLGYGIGDFHGELTNLNPSTTYYIRAYATTDNGTFYGNEVVCTTASSTFTCGDCISDDEGNIYHTVLIGTQCWMRENMRKQFSYTKTQIAHSSGLGIGIAFPNDDITAPVEYGLLYDYNHISGVCPDGWQVPSSGQFQTLLDYATSLYGLNAKSIAAATDWTFSTTNWAIGNNIENNNSTSFSALPAFSITLSSSYQGETAIYSTGVSDQTIFWTTTSAGSTSPSQYYEYWRNYQNVLILESNSTTASISSMEYYNKCNIPYYPSESKKLFSVRCVKN